jgi:hypothetical protein
MQKTFCDQCGDEITDATKCTGGYERNWRLGTEIQRNGVKLRVEILTAKNGTANAGDFCKYCVIEAINALDDRPRPASV